MDRHNQVSVKETVLEFSDFEERFCEKLDEENFRKGVEFFQIFKSLFTFRHAYIFIELLEYAEDVQVVGGLFDRLDGYLDEFLRQRTISPEERGSDNDPSIQQLEIIVTEICQGKLKKAESSTA